MPYALMFSLLLVGCARSHASDPAATPVEREQSVEQAFLYEQILRLDPDNAEAHFQLGNARYQQQQPDKAEYHWRRALALNPHHTKAQISLGLLLRQTGRSR